MKLTKKIIAVVMALMMTLSIGALTANAATVHLKTAQKSATSSTVYGYNKVFWGNNESHSAYSVHFIAKYKMGGVWYTDKSKSLWLPRLSIPKFCKEPKWVLLTACGIRTTEQRS